MTRTEAVERLQTIRSKGAAALQLLESISTSSQAEVQSLALWLKSELQSEYKRVLSARAQKQMTIFELSIYSPTIEEVWKESGISRLKVDGTPDRTWIPTLEAVVYKIGQYID